MATHQFSPKLEEKRPISDALVDDGHNIISESDTPLSNPDMSAYNDSVPEFNDADSKGEGSLRSANEPGNNDEINTLPADDEENVRSDSVVNVKSEDEASKGASDEADGNFLPKIWREERDDEFLKSFEVQLYNLNQQPSNEGGFLKMELDGDTGLKVTTTGFQKDAYTYWFTHYTLNQERRQVVIFENVKCSKVKNKKCVLCTQKAAGSDDYVLLGKVIDEIPERLGDIDPLTAFLKRPKAIGSELLFLKSMLTSKERPLLVGFDGAGQPIPMNKVRKYSSDFQAFFRILEAG